LEDFGFVREGIYSDEEIERLPPLTLAYLGDSVYELFIRTYLVGTGNTKVNKLHKMAIHYVSAKAQAHFTNILKEVLTQREEQILKVGRNAKSATVAKNADVLEYRWATGLEALFGYLYLKKEYERLGNIINKIIDYREGEGVEK
jgi:ribonuclease III family protein